MAPKAIFLFSFILIFLFVQCHAKLLSFSDDQNVSPYKFIKTLQGSQKGAKVKGLNELKIYLHHFGYLNDSYKVQTFGQDEEKFDDVLESAIKIYQVNFNLNVTGSLDADTISMMLLPRCGVPDIVNGETWMRSGKGKTGQDHNAQNKKANMVSHYTLYPGRNRWPSSNPSVTYGFFNTRAALSSLMRQAFNQWVSAITQHRFTFTHVFDAAAADIKIGFHALNHENDPSDGPFDGPGGELAHATPPPVSFLHFDLDDKFSFGDSPGKDEHHLESVAVHEIGHCLGLKHSSDPNAIMFPRIGKGIIKVRPTSDDINGINDLYR